MIRTKKKTAGRNIIVLTLAFVFFALTLVIPLPESVTKLGGAELTHSGRTAVAILVLSLALWLTEALPFHVTGFISVFLLALLNVDTFKNVVFQGFGNDAVVFFIGVLILSSFITRSGLGKRISVFLLSKTGNGTSMIIFGFLIVGAVLAMWITNLAAAAMLMPLARSILEEEKLEPLESNFGRSLMIASAWGPTLGGIAAPSGAGSNPITIGFLKSMAGIEVSFLEWMQYGLPITVLLFVPTWAVLMLFFKPEMKHLSRTKEELRRECRNLPPFTREEKITLTLFLLTIALWLSSPLFEKLLGIPIPIAMPVLFTSSLFFFPGMSGFSWKEVEKEISWSSILLIVTGISLGMMFYTTGAANWLAVALLRGVGGLSPYLQVLSVALLVSALKIVFSSNTVTATIIIPIMIALAENLNLEPLSITLPAGITASMALILVTASPTNVIPYSTGYFTIKDMAVAGTVLTIVTSLIVATTIYAIGTYTGVY